MRISDWSSDVCSSDLGTEIDFRSDYAQFFEDGIAFGGLFTGAEDIKTEEQAQRYGGAAGQPFDPCYHNECDNLGNISTEALELHGDALAFADRKSTRLNSSH